MRLSAAIFSLALFLAFGALGQTGQEAIFKLQCMQACDATIDPCCDASCTYDACLQANAGVSEKADLGQIGTTIRDRSGELAAYPYCKLHLPTLQACRAEEAEAAAARNRPDPFIDLACCRYWAEERDGKIVVTGWFKTPARKTLKYTSEPVHPMSQASTAYGMFALTNGVGYHVYVVDEDNPDLSNGLIYVTRFGETVEPLYILRIGGRFYLRLAPDMSGGHVVYNTPDEPDAFLELELQ